MKSIKVILLLVVMMTMCFQAKADHDQVIPFNQMPEAAQAFLKQHFTNKVPLVVTVDWDDYTIRYESGEKVEFDKNGNWKEIDCRSSIVPTELIPEEIKTNIASTFPGAMILKIDKERYGYEIELTNGLEMKFNNQGALMEVDD